MTPFELLAAGDPRLASTDDVAEARRQLLLAELVGAEPAAHRDTVLRFTDTHPDLLHRSSTTAHLTGSAVVVDAAGDRTLLMLHRKLGRWLQPGGHADGDGNLAAVALREATEETGIEGLRVAVPALDVDVHRVAPPAEQPHLHLDVRYLVVAPPGAVGCGNAESRELRWVRPDQLEPLGLDVSTRRLIERGLAVLAAARAETATWDEVTDVDGPAT
ncbi:MAG: ADP-ribose pyrophosphatase [Acidimicrobiales bacterium]|nr:ADP-ribose pyrophosphatase [Acidimicrobiales bacterium]